MTFLDTGILVGVVLEGHPHHGACLEGYEAFPQPFTNAHALAETFSTLTGFYKVPVHAATELVLGLQDTLTIEALDLHDYEITILESQSRGVMGGGIYDSLHATFARRNRADRIITLNPSHFRHVAPDIEILTP